MPQHILRIDASARTQGSATRDLTAQIVTTLRAPLVTHRDVGQNPPPIIDEAWVLANFTPADTRTDAQRDVLANSDTLVAELEAADTIVIGLPIYNFSVPGALKAWIDQVARAGRTFKYTANGPVGLLQDKKAIIAVASGGTKSGSDIDFATGYLVHVLGFIGIDDVTVVAADQLGQNRDETLDRARAEIDRLAA